MKLIITADVHNGVPGKLRDTIWSINVIRNYAKNNNIKDVIVLGDLFHDRVSLNIEVLNAVYDALYAAKSDGQSWMCFPGNHDCFLKNSWDINSLHVLSNVLTVIEGIDKITLGGQCFHILPFIHQEITYMEKLKEVNNIANESDILLTHIGVCGAVQNACFLLQNWNIVNFLDTKFKRIYTGHYHCHQQIGNTWYPGSPIPFKFDEGFVDHGFFVYDTNSGEHEFIKTFDCMKHTYRPPDYVTIQDTDIVKNKGSLSGNKIRIVQSRDYTQNELETIHSTLRKLGALTIDWKVYDDSTDAKDVVDNERINIDGEDTFLAWLEHDKPDGFDKQLLLTIHDQINKQAQERYVVEESDD